MADTTSHSTDCDRDYSIHRPGFGQPSDAAKAHTVAPHNACTCQDIAATHKAEKQNCEYLVGGRIHFFFFCESPYCVERRFQQEVVKCELGFPFSEFRHSLILCGLAIVLRVKATHHLLLIFSGDVNRSQIKTVRNSRVNAVDDAGQRLDPAPRASRVCVFPSRSRSVRTARSTGAALVAFQTE